MTPEVVLAGFGLVVVPVVGWYLTSRVNTALGRPLDGEEVWTRDPRRWLRVQVLFVVAGAALFLWMLALFTVIEAVVPGVQ